MKRTKGSQSEVGMLYQYGVTALLAAQLSANKHVDDYIIYSSENSAGKFDDVVTRIKLKERDDWYLYLIQVKYKESKRLNVSDTIKGRKIEYFLSDYIQCFNDILNNPNLTCRQDIPNDNITFCIFCDKGIQMPVFLRQDCTFQLNVCRQPATSDATKNVLIPFGNKHWKFVCKDLEKSEFHQHFFDKCWLHLEQANYNKLNKLIEDSCQIKNTKDVINYVKDYFNDDYLYKQGLHKEVFEIELQRIRLLDAIPPLTSLADLINDNYIMIWNEITIKHDVTIMNSTQNFPVEPYLYSCLVQKVNSLLHINIDWETLVSLNRNLRNEVIERFLAYSKTKRFRYWIDPPTTFRLLMIELWKCGDLPLILKTHISLSKFERHAHLKRSYIIVDNWTNRSEEINNSKMNIFTSLSNITSLELQDTILKNTIVSPQGREPVTLKNLLRDDKELMLTFSCTDILKMMRKRTPFLAEGYYKGCDYLAFIIEDEECADISNRIEPYAIGHNFRISYPPGQIDKCINTIREHVDISKYYTVCYLRKTGAKLVLAQGNPQELNHRFVDQYGDPLFISDTHEYIPIIGQTIQLNERKYIPRQLRRVTLPRLFFTTKETQICIIAGDLDLIKLNIKVNNVDDIINETISIENKTYFVNIQGKKNPQAYWRKLCHLKYPIFDIYIRDGKLELLRYRNCKNVYFHISYNGKLFSDQEFFNEIRHKSEEIVVVTGDAGIGKSSFLKWLCNNYSTQNYIIFYDLINLQVDLNKSERQRIDLIDFIFKETQTGLPKQYIDFVSNLWKKKALVWVLDSFDEIRLACEKQVLDLIRNITNFGAQIIIATRIENCKILMDQFDIQLIKIEPLDEKDCLSYWELDQELLANISSELVTNPLYLNFLKIISLNREKLANITKYVLYEKVINMKVKHCLRATYQILRDSDIEQVVLLLERLALVALFGRKVIEQELCWAYDKEVFDMTKFGIITRFNEDNYPIFCHRSFVEFLFAQWITKACQINIYKSAARHLYKRIVAENQLNILNILFEDKDLHRAILQTNIVKIRMIINENSGNEYGDIVDKLGRTALHTAAICSVYSNFRLAAVDILELILTSMLQNGCDMHKVDIINWNWSEYIQDEVFLFACGLRRINIIKTCLKLQRKKIEEHNCPSVVFPMQYFYVLFDEALEFGQFDMISDLLLVENFDNKIFLNFYQACLGLVPENSFCWPKEIQCKELLTPLHVACIYGSVSTIQCLIKIGVDINAADFFTCTPLHYSIMRCSLQAENVNAVKLLLEAGALPNIPILRINQISPLCLAVQTNDVIVVKVLLEVGVNVCYCCADGDTALHFGVRNGNVDIVRYLLLHDTPLRLENKKNETAMDIAVEQNNTEMIKLLNEMANVPVVQKEETRAVYVGPSRIIDVENRCLDNAIAMGNTHLIEILLKKGEDINHQGNGLCTPLHRALYEKNPDVIKLLLNKGADVSIPDEVGNTPLLKAVETGNIPIIEMIMRKGGNTNIANLLGETPLHYAVGSSNAIAVKLLLEKGAYVNAKTLNGVTPLHAAIILGSEDIVQLLLENGADPAILSRIGHSPLYVATLKQNKRIMELLIHKGANVNASTEQGVTPLFLAVHYEDIQMIEMLLEGGANLEAEDATGYTPLFVAATRGNENMVRLLLQKGADANAFTKNNISALFLSAMRAHTHIVTLLLKKNVIIDHKGGAAALQLCASTGDINTARLLLTRGVSANICDDINGWSALHCAVGNGHIDIVDLLLENGAHINANSREYATPLHQAILEKNINLVKLLIDKGASVNAKSTDGDTVLATAIETRNMYIIKILLEKNADIYHEAGAEALGYSVRLRDIEIVKLLLNKGATVNICTKSGYTPLYIATDMGDLDIVKLLLEYEADVNIASANNRLPFSNAVTKKHMGIARLLLNKGANVDTIFGGTTALMLKTHQKDLDFVKFLIKNGANLNIRNTNGVTALEIAVNGEDSNIIDVLLEGGADINSETSDGDSLIRFAARKGRTWLVELLLTRGASLVTDSVTGETFLHDCARNGNINIIEMLLKKKVDLNIQNKMGNTALHIGVIQKDIGVVKLLLDNKANCDITNINGETPFQIIAGKIGRDIIYSSTDDLKDVEIMSSILENIRKINVKDEAVIKSFYWAAEKGHFKIIKLLLHHGVNVNVQNQYDQTPLHIAVINNNEDIVETLLENRADFSLKTKDGFTPLCLANLKGHTSITELLTAFILSLSTL